MPPLSKLWQFWNSVRTWKSWNKLVLKMWWSTKFWPYLWAESKGISCQHYQTPSMYGATALSGPWLPSKDASTFLCLLHPCIPMICNASLCTASSLLVGWLAISDADHVLTLTNIAFGLCCCQYQWFWPRMIAASVMREWLGWSDLVCLSIF
jgi:hypothetical protein